MTTDLSVISLVLEADWPVKIVMILLVIASLMSWTIIFTKRRLIARTKAVSDEFEASFWSGGDLNTLYRGASRDGSAIGMPSIFEAGFREFNRGAKQETINPDKLVEECRRAMRVAQMREVDRLEQSLATLATIGSTSPYVGLFGTVWGIMSAFIGLASTTQTATLQLVAPPIAEALIATAMGLFAAIPAVIAYNRYADKVVRLEYRYDGFSEEFTSILQRHARNKARG